MPVYEYRCYPCYPCMMTGRLPKGIGYVFTEVATMEHSSWPAFCPRCGKLAPRILSAASVNVSAVITPGDIKMTPSAVSQPVAHRRLRERAARWEQQDQGAPASL